MNSCKSSGEKGQRNSNPCSFLIASGTHSPCYLMHVLLSDEFPSFTLRMKITKM